METVLRAAVIYAVLLVILRLSGRRTLAHMTPFDFVLLLIVAETTQQALLARDYSISNSIILILTLFTMDIALSYLKAYVPLAGTALDGAPTVVISNGVVDQHKLRRSRVQLADILEAAREQHGLERLDQIRFAVLEPGGEHKHRARAAEGEAPGGGLGCSNGRLAADARLSGVAAGALRENGALGEKRPPPPSRSAAVSPTVAPRSAAHPA